MDLTGAKNFVAQDNGVSFRLPSTPGFVRKGINHVQITLNQHDLYSVQFGRVWGTKFTVLDSEENVYGSDLRDVFTRVTGLATSLGTMGNTAAA